MCRLFLLTLYVFPALLFSQAKKDSLFSKVKKRDTVFCDCAQAREIIIKGNKNVGPTLAPSGSGEKQEASTAILKSKYAFQKEYHVAWYKLIMQTPGELSFDIIPEKAEDDYDFMLFKAAKNNFCDSLVTYKLKPVRANISRDKKELSGKTGLSINAKKELVAEGVNDAYCSYIQVKKGEVYYLALDNVYENGGGHTIEFFFEKKVNIRGNVSNDEHEKPITNITLTNAKGEVVAETNSDAQSGEYELHTALRRAVSYSINYYNDSSFVFSKNITLKDTVELKSLKTVLPKLRKGKKYSLGSINFFPGSPEYKPQALPAIKNLYKLMEKNKNMRIMIIGYLNCAHEGKMFGPVIGDMEFSGERAEAIRDFLLNNKINSSRVETMGLGCENMLFPKASTPEEEEANRRVEIKVLEY